MVADIEAGIVSWVVDALEQDFQTLVHIRIPQEAC